MYYMSLNHGYYQLKARMRVLLSSTGLLKMCQILPASPLSLTSEIILTLSKLPTVLFTWDILWMICKASFLRDLLMSHLGDSGISL